MSFYVPKVEFSEGIERTVSWFTKEVISMISLDKRNLFFTLSLRI